MNYKTFQSNNDYCDVGVSPEEAGDDAKEEMSTCAEAFLCLRDDLTKEQAADVMTNLSWLVHKSFD